MKSWTKDIEINATIEQVWKYLDGSLENMQKIMPNVVEQKPVTITENRVGSIYRQKYKEGNRIEEYDVKTEEYLDTPEKKKLKVSFILANMFEISAMYELDMVSEDKTRLRYTVTNRPLKWFVKIFLLFATEKVVVEFLERVKNVVEADAIVKS